MLRLVVLISGGGSNLRALVQQCQDPDFPARVVAIGSDREADGLIVAEEYGIPAFTVPFPAYPDRESWGDALAEQLRQWQPDLVILSGLMRLVPPAFVAEFSPNLLNTHPAYLPEFPGAHSVRDALAAGATQTGASVIVVDDTVDGGPILARERVPIRADDTETVLHERIKTVERRLLSQVIRDIADEKLDVKEYAVEQ